MSDSPNDNRLAEKHDRNRSERLEGIYRWVEYIKANPPEVWGPQQNAVVDSQLESAQEAGLTADHERQVRDLADRLAGDPPEDEGET